jgi:hypothetical protein
VHRAITSVYRRVQRFAPLLTEAAQSCRHRRRPGEARRHTDDRGPRRPEHGVRMARTATVTETANVETCTCAYPEL